MNISVLLILLGSLCIEGTSEPSVETIPTTNKPDVQNNGLSTETLKITESIVVAGSSTMKPDNTEESQTTTLSYIEWKEKNEKRLKEKFDEKRRRDQDKANNDLMRNIQSALARPDLSAVKKAELNYVYNLLKRAAEVNDAGVKKTAYDEALGVLISVLSQ